jgi:hypothetical protein
VVETLSKKYSRGIRDGIGYSAELHCILHLKYSWCRDRLYRCIGAEFRIITFTLEW